MNHENAISYKPVPKHRFIREPRSPTAPVAQTRVHSRVAQCLPATAVPINPAQTQFPGKTHNSLKSISLKNLNQPNNL
jgi:hypothetical protein